MYLYALIVSCTLSLSLFALAYLVINFVFVKLLGEPNSKPTHVDYAPSLLLETCGAKDGSLLEQPPRTVCRYILK